MSRFFSKIKLVKLPKHRQFDFTPRYYDERKERLQKREEEIAKELGLEGTENKRREINFRAKLNVKGGMAGHRRKANSQSNMRLIIILVALVAVAYYLIRSLDVFGGK